MTSDDLNQLFASAREIPVETAPDQIAGWVGAAATTSTGVVGVAAKLKLFIAKKSMIMLGITLGSAGIIVLSTALIMQPASSEKNPVNDQFKSSVLITEEDQKPEIEQKEVSETSEEISYQEETNDETPSDGKEPSMLPIPARYDYVPHIRMDNNAQLFSPHFQDRNHQVASHVEKKEKRDAIKGNGEVTKEERSVQPFSAIEISGVFDVVLKQGSKEAVTVETDANLQECVLVENEGSNLILKNSKSKIKKCTKMIVYVTVKDLSRIKTTGVGDVNCENALKTNTLDLVLSNVGDADMNLECQTLNIKYNGVGDLKLSGTANESTIDCSAVGDLKAFDLQVNKMNLTHTGVGDAAISVSEDLTLDFKGVGNVHYKGNPEKKDIKKAGVGSVKNKS